MASSAANRRFPVEVVDLLSSEGEADDVVVKQERSHTPSEVDSEDPDDDPAPFPIPPLLSPLRDEDFLGEPFAAGLEPYKQAQRRAGGTIIHIDGEEVYIPDEDPDEEPEGTARNLVAPAVPAEPLNAAVARDHEVALALDARTVTADDCLQRVLEIFPDIKHEYVIDLYNGFDQEGDYETLPGQARLDNIIEQLVSGSSYPKQDKGKQVLKRKRQDSVDETEAKKWEQQDRVVVPHLKGPMQAMLKAEFPDIPHNFINETLAIQKHLYQTFLALASAKDSSDGGNRPYGKGRPSTKHLADANVIATNSGWPELLDELNAARARVQIIRAERTAEDAKKKAEDENLQKAIEAGETAECSACYDDLPMNRQIHCNGAVAHFTCYDCALTYIKSEVGESRCRVTCTAGCGAGFASQQLHELSDKQLLEKLSQLEQEKDIRDAGLEDLEECPFCDFKAILPPVEEDFEFRCANPVCEKVSCRRCKAISHIPISCEQHAKDNKVNSRHKIEEAMTAALIRSCNKCKKQFIKEYGCNKMTCPSCGNLQCYVCSATLKDYNHFDQALPGRVVGTGKSTQCPLYDNVEERPEREVKEAEAAARAQVVEENPDVTAEDLEIKVSDAVKKQTAARIRQAGGPVGRIMGGMQIPHFPQGRHLNAMLGLGGENEDDDEDDDDDDDDEGRMLGLFDGDDVLGRHIGELAGRHGRREVNIARIQALQNGVNRMARLRHHVGARDPPQPAQAPVANPHPRFGGLGHVVGDPQHVQGYIPVVGYQPRQGLQPPQAYPPPHGLPPPQRLNRGAAYGFVADAAGDGNAPPMLAPLNLGFLHNQQRVAPRMVNMPGGFPEPANAVDWNQQLEALRQQHDQRMHQREQQREQQHQAHELQMRQLQEDQRRNMRELEQQLEAVRRTVGVNRRRRGDWRE